MVEWTWVGWRRRQLLNSFMTSFFKKKRKGSCVNPSWLCRWHLGPAAMSLWAVISLSGSLQTAIAAKCQTTRYLRSLRPRLLEGMLALAKKHHVFTNDCRPAFIRCGNMWRVCEQSGQPCGWFQPMRGQDAAVQHRDVELATTPPVTYIHMKTLPETRQWTLRMNSLMFWPIRPERRTEGGARESPARQTVDSSLNPGSTRLLHAFTSWLWGRGDGRR